MAKGWKQAFDDPIDLPRGRQLVTLKDAADFIMKPPKAEQNVEEWQAATEALIMAAEGRGPVADLDQVFTHIHDQEIEISERFYLVL
jgi:hypothetical protein